MTERHDHSICILTFSVIRNDARVLRQIKYLFPHHDLTVIGQGAPPVEIRNMQPIQWYSIDPPGPSVDRDSNGYPRLLRKLTRLVNSFLLGLGRFCPALFEVWYWSKKPYHQALGYVLQSRCDAILANDWESLPVAAKAASRLKSKVVFDAHEYAPLQFENQFVWRLFFRRAVVHFIDAYSHAIDQALTVSPPISERFRQEFGFEPALVLNAPEKVSLPERAVDFEHVRLVHHGGAIRHRKLESMIRALAFSHKRFSLHFILLGGDRGYLDELRRLAEACAPGRVTFEDPVRPEEIVPRISEYDIGFCFIYPSNYNYRVSLPNKLFDAIAAGLAVLIGPSPAMVEVVKEHQVGWVAPSFEPQALAATLNQITVEDLVMRQSASREAAKKLNADTEMGKLVQVFERLLVHDN